MDTRPGVNGSMFETNLKYNSLEKKIIRQKTIIDNYRNLSGLHTIPRDREYWTLNSSLHKDCNPELEQLIKSDLIKINQFHGINIDAEYQEFNAKKYPEANWYCNNWGAQIKALNHFNPAIVYYDTLNRINFVHNKKPQNDLMNTIQRCPSQCLIVSNWVLNDRYSDTISGDEALMRLEAFKQIIISDLPKVLHQQLILNLDNYAYHSTEGKGRAYMGSIILWKK